MAAHRGRPQVISIERRPARFAESTIAARLQAVLSCYRYHHFNGVAFGGDLVRLVTGPGGGGYKPVLEHLARRAGRRQAVIRVRRPGRAAPVLTPGQIEQICDACASWDAQARGWRGCVRDRLLWALWPRAACGWARRSGRAARGGRRRRRIRRPGAGQAASQDGDLDGLRARADAGDQYAASQLAGLLAGRGDLDGLRARIDAGDEDAAWRLVELLIE